MIFGIVLVIAGLFLAVAPLSAARATARARFAPFSTDEKTVRFYRLAGVALAVIGLLVAVTA